MPEAQLPAGKGEPWRMEMPLAGMEPSLRLQVSHWS